MAPKMKKEKIPFKKRPPIAGDINKEIAQYFASKKEEETAIAHYPEWDEVKGEPIIELMRVHRELQTAEADLAAKREEFQGRRKLAEAQWQELREKQRLLRSSFVKFNEFVRENRDKRERALRKINDEIERQKIREAEIVELEQNLEYMEQVRDKMLSYVEEYRPFQTYLEKVLETGEFHSIAEIFNRYETLIDARKYLVDSQNSNLRKLEDTSIQLQKMTEEKSQSLMDLNSRMAQLQSRHERARANALHWETVVARVKEVISRKELEETQVRACMWNLYRQICRRKGLPAEAKRDELEQQLVHVKRTIAGLGKIVRAAKLKSSHESRTKESPKTFAHQAQPGRARGGPDKPLGDARSSLQGSYSDTRSILMRN